MRCATVVLAASLCLGGAFDTATEGELGVEDILARAIEAQRVHQEENRDVLFDYELLSVTEKLDGDGEVEEAERSRYVSDHVDDVAYERLVEKDGRPLTPDELEDERERGETFREELEERRANDGADGGDDEERIAFDEDLIARYEIELLGIRESSQRDAYVLSFSPRAGDLPRKRRMDRVLNASSGHIWIDRETFEIARLEFGLQEKVRLWWGVVGSISHMTGELERSPVPEHPSVWLPESFDFYMKGRMLFRSLHLRQSVRWSGFELRDERLSTRR